jgi:hypothetical protein
VNANFTRLWPIQFHVAVIERRTDHRWMLPWYAAKFAAVRRRPDHPVGELTSRPIGSYGSKGDI